MKKLLQESGLKKRLLVKLSRKDLRLNKQSRNLSSLKKRGLLSNRSRKKNKKRPPKRKHKLRKHKGSKTKRVYVLKKRERRKRHRKQKLPLKRKLRRSRMNSSWSRRESARYKRSIDKSGWIKSLLIRSTSSSISETKRREIH